MGMAGAPAHTNRGETTLSLKRKLMMGAAAMTLPLGTVLALALTTGTAYAGAPKYNAGPDTVSCDSLSGTLTVSPALNLTGGSPTTDTIKGTLDNCTDGLGALNAPGGSPGTGFTGSISGTLAGTTNSITGLQGCSSSSGTITIKWNAEAGTEKLVSADTTVSVAHAYGATFVPANGGFETAPLSTDGYGSFGLGQAATANSCGSALSSSGAFGGNDSGATGSSYAVTSQDFGAFLLGEESSATKSTIGLGIGDAYFG